MSNERDLSKFPYFEDAHSATRQAGTPDIRTDGSVLPPNIPRDYQNVLVYEPANYNDVQVLIDYLKRKEPAIINLEGVDAEVAQRVLDFTSGAIYALNRSVLRISGNIFLFSPEGVGVTVPHEID